jgi:hypothetical protein
MVPSPSEPFGLHFDEVFEELLVLYVLGFICSHKIRTSENRLAIFFLFALANYYSFIVSLREEEC